MYLCMYVHMYVFRNKPTNITNTVCLNLILQQKHIYKFGSNFNINNFIHLKIKSSSFYMKLYKVIYFIK